MNCGFRHLTTSEHSGKSVDRCLSCGRTVTMPRYVPTQQLRRACLVERTGPCVHASEDLIRVERCNSCSGNVRVKVYGCALYGERQAIATLPTVKACSNCPDYSPKIPVDKCIVTQ